MEKKEIDKIIKVLRRGTLGSHLRNECLRQARKKVWEGERVKTGPSKGKKIFKFYWQCAACEEWWRDSTALEVDHIEEIGPFKGDWNDFIKRMYFCGQDNVRALCTVCHQKKTSGYNAQLRFKRKLKP